MTLVLIISPTIQPVSLTEAKLHLRVSDSAEDTLITSLIVAARERVEAITRRAIMLSTWDYVLDTWPDETEIEIPAPPLASITSITYKDTFGAVNTMSSSDYVVDTDSEPGRVVLAPGKSWPNAALWPVSAIKIRFVAGWATAATVPTSIKQAMLLLIGAWFENREDIGDEAFELPGAAMALLSPYRVWSF